MASEHEVNSTKQLLDQLVNCIISQDYANLNSLMTKATLDLSVMKTIPCNPRIFLTQMKALLSATDSEIVDYALAAEVLDRVVTLCPFEDVLAVFTVDDLRAGLLCTMKPLQISACKVIALSYPKGLFANSDLFDVLLKLLFDSQTDIDLVNEIEKVIEQLKSNELVRRRILENNLPLLEKIRSSLDPVLLARLYEILSSLSECLDRTEFIRELFIVSREEIEHFIDLDVFLFINVTTYYCQLLDVIEEKRVSPFSLVWLLNYIMPVITVYGEIYKNLNQLTDVKHFARIYIFELLRKVSNLDDVSYFENLDKKYLLLSASNPHLLDFLAFVNASYLCQFHGDLLMQHVSISPKFLGVIRNLLSEENSFELIKDKLTSRAILSMPYFEQMVLLEKMTYYHYSAHFLLNSLPKVMSNLIEDEGRNVTEKETVKMRRQAIEYLLRLDSDELNVWETPLKETFARIANGNFKRSAKAEIADTFI